MHPVVKTIIMIACFATFIPPIVEIVRYALQSIREHRKIMNEFREELQKIKADPEIYQIKE